MTSMDSLITELVDQLHADHEGSLRRQLAQIPVPMWAADNYYDTTVEWCT